MLALRRSDGTVVLPSGAEAPQRGTDLPARVAAFLAAHELSPRSLGTVAVDVGPGSYTGLRVAVTFARFVASFTEARLQAFTSLELLAAGAWRSGTVDPAADPRLQVVLDARRGRVHTALLELQDGAVRCVEPPRAEAVDVFAPRARLLAETSALEALGMASTDSTPERAAKAENAGERAAHGTTVLAEPSAEWLFDPALQPLDTAPDDLEPLYLMGTYADD